MTRSEQVRDVGERLVTSGAVVARANGRRRAASRRAASRQLCVANLGWVIEDEGKEREAHEWLVLMTGPSDVFLRPVTQFVEF